ncbi:MAG: hypothetical protein M1816_003550 [Peltula sp. TS41687]|nr:MAG: hypothetical protein M1816_003550 [Peltula sp. TS41687]
MSANLLSYVGWTFLPNMVTGWVQTIYYGIAIRAGDPKPQPGSATYNKHRRRIHILVISAYLLYTIYEADWEIRRAGDFYQDLGLTPDVEDREIKTRFRRLAALYHPDKASSDETRQTSETYFVHLKLAQETLLDPTKRFAYDRFGPDITQWRHCSSVRDYVLVGVQSIAPYYAAGALFMVILGVLGYLEWGRYWRYFSLISLLTFELHTITRPYFPPLTAAAITPVLKTLTNHPPLLPFQQLLLARKIVLTLFIAFSQLGPLLQQQQQQQQRSSRGRAVMEQQQQQQQQQLNRLDQLAQNVEAEANGLLGLEMTPFAEDERAAKDLQARMTQWLVENRIRVEPEVRDAVGRVLARRRAGVEAGAKGEGMGDDSIDNT